MTAVAVAAKTTAMFIVSFVTGDARGWCFVWLRFLVAAFAGQAFVGTIQPEVGVVVIEFPQHPAIGIMTIAT